MRYLVDTFEAFKWLRDLHMNVGGFKIWILKNLNLRSWSCWIMLFWRHLVNSVVLSVLCQATEQISREDEILMML